MRTKRPSVLLKLSVLLELACQAAMGVALGLAFSLILIITVALGLTLSLILIITPGVSSLIALAQTHTTSG